MQSRAIRKSCLLRKTSFCAQKDKLLEAAESKKEEVVDAVEGNQEELSAQKDKLLEAAESKKEEVPADEAAKVPREGNNLCSVMVPSDDTPPYGEGALGTKAPKASHSEELAASAETLASEAAESANASSGSSRAGKSRRKAKGSGNKK
eukprot:TRINITY_DN11844_c1_g1_i4.p1 TRINITY_DN11844_c1_g1~~TRINITY_DN11844_c1_g1_i4.p1  ORF type:complete len:149 (-),score=55.16 TRINITY_DN11844_c1_g1_i4:67-513(-)